MVAVSPALAERLHAAEKGRRWVHHIDCGMFDEADPYCTCDVPDLLRDLAALLLDATGPARLLETGKRPALGS